MAATTYTIENVLNALIRGQTFTQSSDLWVALHTDDPGKDGSNEVSTTDWPSYVRRDSLQGDTRENAWSAPDSEGITWNQKQLIFPVFDGSTEVTITHISVFDAESNGNCLFTGALETPRQIGPSQVFVSDTDKLGAKLS